MLVELQVLIYLGLLSVAVIFAQGLAIPLKFGLAWDMSNRDEPRELTRYMQRAIRTLNNHLQSLAMAVPLLIALVLLPEAQTDVAHQGAWTYVLARSAYALAYLVGIPYLRSLLWLIGIVAIGMMAAPLLALL